MYLASIGTEITSFAIDSDAGTLSERSTITLPANVQYAWQHPSRRHFYVASSDGGPGKAGSTHRANAVLIDPTTGALELHGDPVSLPSRPIHTSVDGSGAYLLTAYNNPSDVTVHRLSADGTIGAPVARPGKLDTGIYAHQILSVPSNRTVILVTRGNDASPGKPEDPGAIKTFAFHDGVLSDMASIAPGSGLGFGPRHLDFHPTKPWVFVSIERQNKLYVYKLDPSSGLACEPLFIKDTLANQNGKARQAAGAIHVHPNGRFVYVTNRASTVAEVEGRTIFTGGENSIAVFAIDQETGEPTLIQHCDGHAIELRTFGIDPSGRMLIAASVKPTPVREGNSVSTLMPRRVVFRIGEDGKLEFVRQYDVDTGGQQQFWSGIITLP